MTSRVFLAICVIAIVASLAAPWPTTKTQQVSILIVEETSERATLPESQIAILTSSELRSWLESRCQKNADGTIEFRILDKDADDSNLNRKWKERFNISRKMKTPNIAVSNGVRGADGDLPLTIEETKKIVEKFAGE